LPPPAASSEAEKKRGFWSRFFGAREGKPKNPKRPPQP
jgi:hypothetical protein